MQIIGKGSYTQNRKTRMGIPPPPGRHFLDEGTSLLWSFDQQLYSVHLSVTALIKAGRVTASITTFQALISPDPFEPRITIVTSNYVVHTCTSHLHSRVCICRLARNTGENELKTTTSHDLEDQETTDEVQTLGNRLVGHAATLQSIDFSRWHFQHEFQTRWSSF